MVCSGKEESGELHAAADCLGKEDKMHGRNLRARGVASVDEYIGVLGTPHNDVAARLREIVLKRYPQLREDIKWHVPVYSLGTTPIVSIEGFKAHVNLKFLRGAVLRDRWHILEGTGKGCGTASSARRRTWTRGRSGSSSIRRSSRRWQPD